MNVVLIIAIGVVLCLALVYFNYRHNHRISYHEARLKGAIDRIFDEANGVVLDKKVFLFRLKQVLRCTQKEALYLYGVAKGKGLIVGENAEVRQVA